MNENTVKKEKGQLGKLIENFGLPRLIIALFLVLLLILAPIVGADFWTQISNIIFWSSWLTEASHWMMSRLNSDRAEVEA